MEILLAIVVASAVVFFGALISMGNDRQKKAIDSLREEVVMWAEQDLRMKRGRLSLEIRVDDPVAWFSQLATHVLDMNTHLTLLEISDNRDVVTFNAGDHSRLVMFSTLSPTDIRRLKSEHHRKHLNSANDNPLLSLPRQTVAKKITIVNGGFLFDLEFPLAWKAIKGQDIGSFEQVWMYTQMG